MAGLGDGVDGLAAYRWRKRVLIAFAPSRDAPELARQRQAVAALGRDGDDRDLVLLELAGEGARSPAGTAQALRRKFDVAAGGFTVLLIGKDGGVKMRSNAPIPARSLASTIDAMPMRREEMRRAAR